MSQPEVRHTILIKNIIAIVIVINDTFQAQTSCSCKVLSACQHADLDKVQGLMIKCVPYANFFIQEQ